jgi:hypothetical protein
LISFNNFSALFWPKISFSFSFDFVPSQESSNLLTLSLVSSFHEEVDQQLSDRTLSPELLEANKIIADRDRDIEYLKEDIHEILKEYPVTSNSTLLFLPNNLAMEIYDAVRDNVSSSSSSANAAGFNLEHNGEEVTAVYRIPGSQWRRKKMIVKGKAHEANIVLNKIELARCFAPRKYEIKEAIAELRLDKELPLKNATYKPNYEKIKNIRIVF